MRTSKVKSKNSKIFVSVVICAIIALSSQSFAQMKADGGMTMGGGSSSSANFGAKSASGLMVVGKAESTNFKATAGLVTPIEAIILALLDFPTTNASLSGVQTVSGTASNQFPAAFNNYELSFARGKAPATEPNPCAVTAPFTSVSTGTAAVIAASLGSWDTSLLAGTFTLGLKVTDTSGNVKKVCVPVAISNNASKTFSAPATEIWRILSFPVDLAAAEVNKILTVTGLKIFRWDPAAPDDPATSRFRVPTTVEKGKSYWVKVPTATSPVTVTGALIDQTQPLPVSLAPGWNMVSNPFIFNIAWGAAKVEAGGTVYSLSAAATAGIIGNYFYSFSSDAFTQTTAPGALLEPEKGYYVYAFQAANLLLVPESAPPPSSLAKAAGVTDTLKINISAATGSLKDADNAIGFSTGAQDTWDEYDIVKAPLAPRLEATDAYLTLYFPHEGGEEGTGWDASRRAKYANDIRKANKNRGKSVLETWKMVVSTNAQNQPVELTWAISNPEGNAVTLKDKVSGATVDMNKQASYSYTPKPSEMYGGREFDVVVLPKGSLFAADSNSLFAGKVYNFPNPDRIGNATFRYSVNPLKVVRLAIEVFNVAGKHIKTLEVDPYSTEYHWNFDLSSGVYVYRITAYGADGSKENQVSKLVVLK